jgi:hypothetical protein
VSKSHAAVHAEGMKDAVMKEAAMNGFAMIFGHCVWIPPSPKAALAALSLFFGIGIQGQPDISVREEVLASQYVAAGKTQGEAHKEVDALNSCFGTYDVPPENTNHPQHADVSRVRQAPTSIGK